VHREIYAPVKQRMLDITGKQPLVTDLREWCIKDPVPLGLDDFDLSSEVRMEIRQPIAHPTRLPKGEFATSTAYAQ
jgi:hypothetical protein